MLSLWDDPHGNNSAVAQTNNRYKLIIDSCLMFRVVLLEHHLPHLPLPQQPFLVPLPLSRLCLCRCVSVESNPPFPSSPLFLLHPLGVRQELPPKGSVPRSMPSWRLHNSVGTYTTNSSLWVWDHRMLRMREMQLSRDVAPNDSQFWILLEKVWHGITKAILQPFHPNLVRLRTVGPTKIQNTYKDLPNHSLSS